MPVSLLLSKRGWTSGLVLLDSLSTSNTHFTLLNYIFLIILRGEDEAGKHLVHDVNVVTKAMNETLARHLTCLYVFYLNSALSLGLNQSL